MFEWVVSDKIECGVKRYVIISNWLDLQIIIDEAQLNMIEFI